MRETRQTVLVIAAMIAALIIVVGVALPIFAQRVAWELNGGDNYAYLRADRADIDNDRTKLRIWIEATGPMLNASIWISPYDANRDYNDERYYDFADESRAMSSAVLYKGGFYTGRELPPGRYWVEITTRNGTVLEELWFGDNVPAWFVGDRLCTEGPSTLDSMIMVGRFQRVKLVRDSHVLLDQLLAGALHAVDRKKLSCPPQ